MICYVIQLHDAVPVQVEGVEQKAKLLGGEGRHVAGFTVLGPAPLSHACRGHERTELSDVETASTILVEESERAAHLLALPPPQDAVGGEREHGRVPGREGAFTKGASPGLLTVR